MVPDEIKIANVILVYKCKASDDCSNYRFLKDWEIFI